MRWNDDTYLRAYDHNYRVAYEEGLAHLSQGASQEKAFKRLRYLLHRTGMPAAGTRVLDLGCGDGTNGIFVSSLGYDYTGIDISEAAVERARLRAAQDSVEAAFQVGDVLDLDSGKGAPFPIILDAYCFHMLVLDAQRSQYFRGVMNVLQDDGYLVLIAQRDEKAYEGHIESFEAFCRLTDADPSGVPFQKCVDGRWSEVSGKRNFLMGRPRSISGYRGEFTRAGFRIEYQVTWDGKKKAAFLLRKMHRF